ncbi:hypothetical protein HK101_005026 [Irineochytrium annulatum]|nr:hypothetical protein HK101_005026 [Irineochytrium annulatum]
MDAFGTRIASGRRPPSAAVDVPAEILLQILSHFDPHPRDAAAFLSPASTTTPLAACALVSKWWNQVANSILWKRPMVYEAAKFERLVDAGSSTFPLMSAAEHGADAFGDLSLVGEDVDERSEVPAVASRQCASPNFALIRHLALSATLSETHRYSPRLSSLLSRFLDIPGVGLTTLDLSFCKGVSNFSLQRSAHRLTSLEALNLAGGCRSEICVIKIATECPRLRRLGLGWNTALGDFCVREVARLCPLLEWLDLSGCGKIGDSGCTGIAKGLGGRFAASSTLSAASSAPAATSPYVPTTLAPVPIASSSLLLSMGAPSSPWVKSHAFPSPPTTPSSMHRSIAAAEPTSLTVRDVPSRPASPFLSMIPPPAATPPSRSATPILPSQLRYLNLSYCTNVTDVGLREVLERCADAVEVVNVMGCPDVTMEATQGVAAAAIIGAATAGQGIRRKRRCLEAVLVKSSDFVPFA